MLRLLLAASLSSSALPAQAQETSADARIRRLETEVRQLREDLKELRGGRSPAAAPAPIDAAEEAYMAGYRHWEQKRYAEAQKALEDVARKFPKHRRASYARNLAGRAYLDDGKPASAAIILLRNHEVDPRGERAGDSLYYLGQSLVALNKPAEACRVYRELQRLHGSRMREPLRQKLRAAQAGARCGVTAQPVGTRPSLKERLSL